MSHKIVDFVLSSALAASGTQAVNYPSGYDGGDFEEGTQHKLVTGQKEFSAPEDFTISTFGQTDFTITWGSGNDTVAAGETLSIQLDMPGRGNEDSVFEGNKIDRAFDCPVLYINLGSPVAADPDGIAAAQAVAGAGNLTINGALASGGEVEFDVPRAVEIDSSNAGDTTQTATVTGTDVYGNAMTEDIAFNGTTAVAGKKAFKKVTQIAIDAALAGNANAGSTDVLGLPVFMPGTGNILAEMEDGSAATAGTTVAGVASDATATTGDVRGTYDPNSACDGQKAFALVVALPDPNYRGTPQA